MKLGIIIPNEEYKLHAGFRIRYMRIKSVMETLGHRLDFIPIQMLPSNLRSTHDIYLISKCYDARAILAAQRLQAQGAKLGVDLFDDYFSQYADYRFEHMRYWLRSILNFCDFVLCSSPHMQEIAKSYAPHLSAHVMNDPSEPFNAEALAKTLDRKLERVRSQRRIEVAWFGMGDNPYFPVGFDDLATHGREIDRLRGYGFDVQLSILTNLRAMTADNLAKIRRLATPYSIEEWSLEREAALLQRSLLSCIPVNANPFSRAKSLNRAITSLTAGTQVLSLGYPLYRALDPFIYSCARLLMADIERNELRLRSASVTSFSERIRQLGDVETEAKKLLEFLMSIQSFQFTKEHTNKIFSVIHGKESLADTHNFAKKVNVLSVASPFCKLDLDFDFAFRYSKEGKLTMMVNKKKVDHIDAKFVPMLKCPINPPDSEYLSLNVSKVFSDIKIPAGTLIDLKTPAAIGAIYKTLMKCVIEILERIMPTVSLIVSERCIYVASATSIKPAGEIV